MFRFTGEADLPGMHLLQLQQLNPGKAFILTCPFVEPVNSNVNLAIES
jgi:hypothetical protein